MEQRWIQISKDITTATKSRAVSVQTLIFRSFKLTFAGHIGVIVDDVNGFCSKLDAEKVTFVKRPTDGKLALLCSVF